MEMQMRSRITGLRSGEGRPVGGIRRRGVRPHVVVVNITDKYVENRLRGEPRNEWIAGHPPREGTEADWMEERSTSDGMDHRMEEETLF